MSNICKRPVVRKGQRSIRQSTAEELEDEAFLLWLRDQPSCIDGAFSEYHDDGSAKNIPAHVRRARDAGTAFKPKLSAVPLTNAQHKLQSEKGEAACLERYLGGEWTVAKAKAWFNIRAIEYVKRWRAECRR